MLTVLTVQSPSTFGHCTTYARLLCARMTYMYLSDTVFASFVHAYDLHVFVCHCGCKEDQLYPDDGQSRCFYHPI